MDERVRGDYEYGLNHLETVKKRLSRESQDFPAFYYALYHALRQYYLHKKYRSMVISETFLWSQLGPFVLMDENLAVDNLIDFLKFCEKDKSLNLDELKFHLNYAIINHPDQESYGYLFIAKALREVSPDVGDIGWFSLLVPASVEKIHQLQSQVNEFQLRLIA